MTKATWGRKGLFALYFHITGHPLRESGQELKQGRNLKPGADAEAMEGHCLLPASPCFLSLLSYRTQDHQSRGGTTHNGLPPYQSLIKKMPYRLACSLIFLRICLFGWFGFWDRVSLCSLDCRVRGWLQTHRAPPESACRVLGLNHAPPPSSAARSYEGIFSTDVLSF